MAIFSLQYAGNAIETVMVIKEKPFLKKGHPISFIKTTFSRQLSQFFYAETNDWHWTNRRSISNEANSKP